MSLSQPVPTVSENARLAASLRWAVAHMADGLPAWAAVPRHECEFYSNPEKGACDFHDAWAEAKSLVNAATPAAEESDEEAELSDLEAMGFAVAQEKAEARLAETPDLADLLALVASLASCEWDAGYAFARAHGFCDATVPPENIANANAREAHKALNAALHDVTRLLSQRAP